MTAPRTHGGLADGDRETSLQLARRRDATICRLLEDHPVTAAMLVKIGLFTSKNKALQRLRKLVRRRRIRLVGTVCRGPGRPEHSYCRWRPNASQLNHELDLTEVCLRVEAAELRRGPAVQDRTVLPDAEVTIGREVYYLELDRGTMSHSQIGRRFRLYEGCPHISLWVCSTPERAEALRSRASRIAHGALFTTLARALADPHGPIWVDHHGQPASLPREAAVNRLAVSASPHTSTEER